MNPSRPESRPPSSPPGGSPESAPGFKGRQGPHQPPLILGLAGGIGAGKSAVARAFQRLGCAVIDSDAEAKAALDRHQVQDTLKQWWGAEVIGSDGKTDRQAISRLIFADPAQRTRLEGLIHPLIRRTRESAQAEAKAANAAAIIYDAPLLFEAGIDKLCDAVIWVECPREERLRRVTATRGWTDAELAKREAAQWPIEKKRAMCSHEIDNGAESTSRATGGSPPVVCGSAKPQVPGSTGGKPPVAQEVAREGGGSLDKRAAELLAILLREQAPE